ncbi:hypothetical protein [Saccharopolyspora taberi]|uniref:Uncharacterized protein n=1 Tax=Saccharopolyspora taberi TaxID=60895 RepID=A0ABN3VJI7_9PSEU
MRWLGKPQRWGRPGSFAEREDHIRFSGTGDHQGEVGTVSRVLSELDDPELNNRELAALRAVAAGRVEMTCSSEPDLYVDGLLFSDQATARRLVHRGFLTGAVAGVPGARVPAVLTGDGVACVESADPNT